MVGSFFKIEREREGIDERRRRRPLKSFFFFCRRAFLRISSLGELLSSRVEFYEAICDARAWFDDGFFVLSGGFVTGGCVRAVQQTTKGRL